MSLPKKIRVYTLKNIVWQREQAREESKCSRRLLLEHRTRIFGHQERWKIYISSTKWSQTIKRGKKKILRDIYLFQKPERLYSSISLVRTLNNIERGPPPPPRTPYDSSFSTKKIFYDSHMGSELKNLSNSLNIYSGAPNTLFTRRSNYHMRRPC